MRSIKVPITAISKSLFELGGFSDPNCNEVLIQAPNSNANHIYFGQHGNEVGFIVNGGSAGLSINSLKNIYIKGSPPDELIIIVV